MFQFSDKFIYKGEENMKSKDLDLISISEVCDRLQISRNTAYKLLKRCDLEGVRVGRMWRIPDKSILNYIMQRKKEVYNGKEKE